MSRAALALGGLVLAAGTAAAAPAPASAEALLDRFAANSATLDVAAQAALFAPDAAFFGSSVPGLLRGPEGARGYFAEAWAKASPGTMTCEVQSWRQPSPDLVLVSAWCRLVRPERTAQLRLSGAAQRGPDGWRFAELHVSAAPAPR
ncbi:nuclear transport factor 2 family protein [Dankookia sp. P2]|uniref:nuclear transport factor 2 family protein n=1 Tax=Dankookia sp. P2 TaxID=3423955 RepID=UPI003D669225